MKTTETEEQNPLYRLLDTKRHVITKAQCTHLVVGTASSISNAPFVAMSMYINNNRRQENDSAIGKAIDDVG